MRKIVNNRIWPAPVIAMVLFAGEALGQSASAPVEPNVEISLLVPDDIKPTGQHGTVLLVGDVTDGKLVNLKVTASSGAPLIDQRAIQKLTNAPLGADLLAKKPTAIKLKLSFYNTRGLDFGQNYPCSQAVLDTDWYRGAFPDRPIERTPLYDLIRAGGGVMGDKRLAFANDPEKFERVWNATIERCRDTPTIGFTKTLTELGAK